MTSAPGGPRVDRGLATAALFLSMFVLAWVGVVVGLPGCGREATVPLSETQQAADQGDWRKVADLARRRLREAPDDPDALRALARASIQLGRVDVAQGIYERLGADGMRSEDRALLAEFLLNSGESDSALRLLEEGLALGPEHPHALYLRARLWAGGDRLAEARPLAEQLSKLDKYTARGWLLRAQIADAESNPEQAAIAYEQVLGAEPGAVSLSPAELRTRLARALLAGGQAERARQVLAEVGASSSPEVQWLLSRAWLQLGDRQAASTALANAGNMDRKPMDPEPAPYSGAAACLECHKEITQAQQASHHGKTLLTGAGLLALPTTAGPVADPQIPGVSYQIDRAADGLRLVSSEGGQQARLAAEFGFGSGDRGATPVGRDASGTFRELRLSFYRDHQGWDVTTGQKPPTDCAGTGPACYLGRVLTEDGVRRCFDCHSTNARLAQEQKPPAGLDHGIGCERCHGPAENHVKAMNAAPAFSDMAIARPRVASNPQTLELCARCHSPRGVTVRRDDPASIRFQATTLTWSRCATQSQGALSCLSCHDPHRNAQTDPAYYVQKCLTCHAGPNSPPAGHAAGDGARPIELAASVVRKPCPVNPGDGCIDCHMPTRTNALPHTKFTDHFIRVHPAEKPE